MDDFKLFDSEPMHGSGPITRAEMTCRRCDAVFSIWNEATQAVHFATGLCKACLREGQEGKVQESGRIP